MEFNFFEIFKALAQEKAEENGHGVNIVSCIETHEVLSVHAVSDTDTYDMMTTTFVCRVDGYQVDPSEVIAKVNGPYVPYLVAGNL